VLVVPVLGRVDFWFVRHTIFFLSVARALLFLLFRFIRKRSPVVFDGLSAIFLLCFHDLSISYTLTETPPFFFPSRHSCPPRPFQVVSPFEVFLLVLLAHRVTCYLYIVPRLLSLSLWGTFPPPRRHTIPSYSGSWIVTSRHSDSQPQDFSSSLLCLFLSLAAEIDGLLVQESPVHASCFPQTTF